jgi:peptidoglycan/LPS O-acetylase OafA/YrhL
MELAHLTGLRGIAALEVLVFHAAAFFRSKPLEETDCELGVMVFFMLSGFLMGHLYLNEPCTPQAAFRYALLRAARVLPLYFVGILTAAAYWAADDEWLSMPVLRVGLLMTGNVKEVGQLWTVGVEIRYYCIFLAVWFLRYVQPALFAAVAAAGVAVYTAFYLDVTFPQLISLPLPNYIATEASIAACCCQHTGPACVYAYLPVFFFGTALGTSWERCFKPLCASMPMTTNTIGLLTFIFGLLLNTIPMRHRLGLMPQRLMLGSYFPTYRIDLPGAYHLYELTFLDAYNWLALGALILCAAAGPQSISVLASSPLKWIGQISYGLYIFHFFLFAFLHDTLAETPDGLTAGLFAGIAAVFFLSWLSFRFVEAPLIRSARRFADGVQGTLLV